MEYLLKINIYFRLFLVKICDDFVIVAFTEYNELHEIKPREFCLNKRVNLSNIHEIIREETII